MSRIIRKYLLIVGAGIELVEFYLEAKKMGLNIVGIDKNPNAPAFKYADKKIISSTRNAEQALNKTIKFSKKNKIIGVTTSSHDIPLTIAKIGKKLGLKSISIKNAIIASNKKKMKEFFLKNKIKSSKYFLCKNIQEFNKKKIRLPLIIKPIDGRGSRGVTYHENLLKINWAINYAQSNSNFKKVLVEEFIKGKQLSVEGFVYKKKYFQSAISKRNYSNLQRTKPYIVENGGNLPASISKKNEKKIIKFCSKIVKCLNLNSGSIKFDLVVDGEEIKCIEFALRLSGGYFSSLQIPKVYNINLMKITILNCLNKKITEKDLIPKKNGYMVVRYIFPNKKGKYLGLRNKKLLKDKKKIFYFRKLIKKNNKVNISKHHGERLATFAIHNKSLKKAISYANYIEHKVTPIIC